MSDNDQRTDSDDSAVCTLSVINKFDGDGLWVTVFDDDGSEIELTVTGLTPERLTAFLAGRQVRVARWVDGKPQYTV